jgi:ABC-2 type transport system permease protein
MSAAALTLRKWRAVFGIYIQDSLAYRAQSLIWLIGDGVLAVVMPLVWIAAADGNSIQGYDTGSFVVYYLSSVLVGSFVTCHFMWDISNEIREGIFSTHLIRPIGYFQFTFVRNLAYRTIRPLIFLPIFVLLVAGFWKYLAGAEIHLGWQFLVAVLLGHSLSCVFATAFAMIALFTQEAHSIFELYYVPLIFFSGQLFPIALLPPWAQTLAHWTPFYYMLGVPLEILVGKIEPAAYPQIMLTQIGWIAVSYGLYRLMFKLGMKHYTSVGM